MRNQPMLQRKLQHLACTAAVFALATAGLTLAGTKPVLAEFEIQEAGIENVSKHGHTIGMRIACRNWSNGIWCSFIVRRFGGRAMRPSPRR